MLRTRKTKGRRTGFTLLEVLLVVGILVAIAAVAIPNLIGAQDTAKLNTAKLQVQSFDQAVKQFKIIIGNFPGNDEGLQALVTGGANRPANWTPIMAEANVADPWNRPFQYRFPGSRNPLGASAPDIWSNGPDGVEGTADDVGNWRN